MPDPSLSAAIKEAYASAPTDEVVYHTLTFTHPSFTVPAFVVNGFDDITTGDGLGPYIALPFSLELPEVSNQAPPQMRMTVDNVSRELLYQIDRAAEEPEPIIVTYRQYLASDLSKAQNDPPLMLHLSSIEVTATKITGIASVQNFTNRRFPKITYRDEEYPGLIR